MQKSHIFSTVVLSKGDKPEPAWKVVRNLAATLKRMCEDINQWDQEVDPDVATNIIRQIGSTKRDMTMEQIIRDIDMMLKRQP